MIELSEIPYKGSIMFRDSVFRWYNHFYVDFLVNISEMREMRDFAQ